MMSFVCQVARETSKGMQSTFFRKKVLTVDYQFVEFQFLLLIYFHVGIAGFVDGNKQGFSVTSAILLSLVCL